MLKAAFCASVMAAQAASVSIVSAAADRDRRAEAAATNTARLDLLMDHLSLAMVPPARATGVERVLKKCSARKANDFEVHGTCIHFAIMRNRHDSLLRLAASAGAG